MQIIASSTGNTLNGFLVLDDPQEKTEIRLLNPMTETIKVIYIESIIDDRYLWEHGCFRIRKVNGHRKEN